MYLYHYCLEACSLAHLAYLVGNPRVQATHVQVSLTFFNGGGVLGTIPEQSNPSSSSNSDSTGSNDLLLLKPTCTCI